jgi:Gluconate 2-dehydrogenase subunit 3
VRGPFRAPDQRAVTPQHRGRFPGFDVLDEAHRWDDVTAGVVLSRLAPTVDLSFFTLAENGCATALADLLLAQDAEPRVPVVAMIDARLAAGETDGWHFDDMPLDGEAWRRSLAALDEDAEELGGSVFARLAREQQAALVQRVQDLGSDGEEWHDMPAKHVWSLWTRYACAAFYSHPWAWNEMGFPGPAYPRGYKNTGVDARERFEVRDTGGEDPVPFADRVERARKRHAELVAMQLEDGR